jgi:hypothetical protein
LMLAAKEIFEAVIAFYYTHPSGLPPLFCLVFHQVRLSLPSALRI